jgi:hypothetical protein
MIIIYVQFLCTVYPPPPPRGLSNSCRQPIISSCGKYCTVQYTAAMTGDCDGSIISSMQTENNNFKSKWKLKQNTGRNSLTVLQYSLVGADFRRKCYAHIVHFLEYLKIKTGAKIPPKIALCIEYTVKNLFEMKVTFYVITF